MKPLSYPKPGEPKGKSLNAQRFVLGIIISLLVTYLYILGMHDWNQGLFFWLQSQQAPNPAWSSPLFRVNIFGIWKERLPSERNISWTASPNGLTNTYRSLIPHLLGLALAAFTRQSDPEAKETTCPGKVSPRLAPSVREEEHGANRTHTIIWLRFWNLCSTAMIQQLIAVHLLETASRHLEGKTTGKGLYHSILH